MSSLLLLAASREGAHDPLAQAHDVGHKCLVPVGGEALILHPLRAALAVREIKTIFISTDDGESLRKIGLIAQAERQGRVKIIPAAHKLADSVLAAGALADFPLTITTADSALLTPDALRHFMKGSSESEADATLALAAREAVLAAHPEGQKRFYSFADGAFSNCNLYGLRSPDALAGARAFAGGGQFAKHPARIAAAFGIVNLVLFRLGLLRLAAMMRRLSRVFGVSIEAIIMADGRLAIDVDNARTHAIAEMLIGEPQRAAA
ncbi:NTP transferase domain-containing protein [Sphingobium sp. CR28]|uniref:NTP transferase domain-containing protein n=1 Tax=Sphingobium sp. CR28 TaxID=3400272 RepID=UPI003FF10C0A